MPIKSDAQAARSRRWILEALMSLMGEIPFESITISQISGRADLDRRTFYRHYKSKEDVIADHIGQMAGQYEAVLRKRQMNTREIALAFFTLCQENAELLELLHRNHLLPLLLYELNRIFPQLHNKYHTTDDPYRNVDAGYALSYHVGGFWNMLIHWLDGGRQKSPDELAAILHVFLPNHI